MTNWGPTQSSVMGGTHFLKSKHPPPPVRFRVLKTCGREWNKTGLSMRPYIFLTIQSSGWQMSSRERGMGMDDIIWATCLCRFGLDLSRHYFLIVECKKGEGDPRKWRKIGDYGDDLWGIPTCRAEIGNWAVVIIGCRIDVVPINQNCWINKKFFKVPMPWWCLK